MNFIKMHGLGNDFIVIDQFRRQDVDDPSALARSLCARGFSVGADGLVLALPSDKADARMRIFNPDGSEPEMCGNAIRCVARYLRESGLVSGEIMSVETLAGIMRIAIRLKNGEFSAASVDMGVPAITGRHRIPVADTDAAFTAVSTGNPHAVTWDVWPDEEIFRKYGPTIERHALFPAGTNVEFCRVDSPTHAHVRVWERGTGPTLACGTGATAAFYALAQAGILENRAVITLPGGDLEFRILENGHAIMTGPAEVAYHGQIN